MICIRCHDYRRQDILLAIALYALVPCHLFIAYLIESQAASHAKDVIGRRKKDETALAVSGALDSQSVNDTAWIAVAIAHGLNASLCFLITSFVVFYHIHHPLIGTVSQLHAIIVWLKNCSYAFTNRDLRHAMLHPHLSSSLPELYSTCPYPRNITVRNLSYFWWAPTLVYQPVYPRSSAIRWSFVCKRLAEFAGLSVFIWLASAQYAAPVLRNSLDKIASLDVPSMAERLMKLSTISLIIWLAGFYAIFHSILNALAEIMTFGDREFYLAWWQSDSLRTYWKTWNKPVYQFMRRHVHTPLVKRGWRFNVASAIVFIFSGFLHEALVGIPTHSITGVAFGAMIIQIPLVAATTPLENMQGRNWKIVGNCVFWVSFCLVGQPFAALYYFFTWQAKYGTVSRKG